MNDRYIGRVVNVMNPTTVVVNIGTDHGVRNGSIFLLVGLGEKITDPDTGEILEQLELVRGRVEVTHAQQKISTLTSVDVLRDPDIKEIKRSGHGGFYSNFINPVTESVKVGVERAKPLSNPKIGDYIIEE